MRIAVYFAGHVRTAEYAVENLLNYIGDLYPNIDIFLHTWKENGYKRLHHESRYFKKMLIDQNVEVPSDILKLDRKYFFPTTAPETYSVLEKLNKLYNKKIVSVEVEQSNTKIGFLPKFGRKPSRFYAWYRVNEMRKRYEELNEFKYDVIVKTRPDALFSTDSSLRKDIEHCLAHPENSNTMFSCNDIVFVALPSVMDIASDFMVKSDTIEYGHYLDSNNIKIKPTPTRNWAIYRAESIPNSSLNFDHCKDQDQGWYFPIVRGVVRQPQEK